MAFFRGNVSFGNNGFVHIDGEVILVALVDQVFVSGNQFTVVVGLDVSFGLFKSSLVFL